MATTTSKASNSLEPRLNALSISSSKKPSKIKPAPSSWEEEAASPTSSSNPSSPSTPTQQALHEPPDPPPPTPISPTHRRGKSTDWASFPSAPGLRSSPREAAAVPERRPEKSNAAAGRMIAGALGVKTKMSDEQKNYERAVREKERKRIEGEREEGRRREREREELQRAVWDD